MTNGVEVYTYDPSKKCFNDHEIKNLPLIPLPIYKKIFFSGSKSKDFFRGQKNFFGPEKLFFGFGPRKKIFLIYW